MKLYIYIYIYIYVYIYVCRTSYVSPKLIFHILICFSSFQICSLLKLSTAFMPEMREFTESFDTNESNCSQVYYNNLLFWHLQIFAPMQ